MKQDDERKHGLWLLRVAFGVAAFIAWREFSALHLSWPWRGAGLLGISLLGALVLPRWKTPAP